ncbi:MAG: hypothetical protein JOY95_10325 [Silvibacterium sp.]|nr:hypothetical protein [Silvibacterium sp.]
MGIVVFSEGREVWSPSLKVGALFMAQISALEKAFDVKSGIISPLADELEIDASTFVAFVQKVMDSLTQTNNRSLIVLSAGCLQVAIALIFQITGIWPAIPKYLDSFLGDAHKVMLPLRERDHDLPPRTTQ